MSDIEEARRVIERMRAQRGALGDTTNTTRRLHYKRIKRPKLASIVLYFYTFVSGALFSTALLTGGKAAWFCLALILVALVITHLRE
jgi:hypothetical protein